MQHIVHLQYQNKEKLKLIASRKLRISTKQDIRILADISKDSIYIIINVTDH